ncbi:MAG: hypothetical protein ACW98F_05580 [Candidatus Hodarchaeales archaeon]|jgi:predicted ArsR family transcriptional regulator
MSNNQLLRVLSKPKVGSTDRRHSLSRDKPSIVHELDQQVLDILEQQGPLTRGKLVSLTGIARSTLYDSLLRLILKGYVASYSEDRRHRGRPKVFYRALN